MIGTALFGTDQMRAGSSQLVAVLTKTRWEVVGDQAEVLACNNVCGVSSQAQVHYWTFPPLSQKKKSATTSAGLIAAAHVVLAASDLVAHAYLSPLLLAWLACQPGRAELRGM
jgi:1,4-dihydroxy-2-naphthoate octaprenyltransferase